MDGTPSESPRQHADMVLVWVTLALPEAAAQIVSVQAPFDEADSSMGLSGGVDLPLDKRTGSTPLLTTRAVLSGQ